jgi:alpha-methylacyl-CoA racemase
MLLVIGVLAALAERSRSGKGQVVDVAMVDGVALLTTLFHGMRAEGLWSDVPGTNLLDLGSPTYNVYETADGRYITLGGGAHHLFDELGVADDEVINQRNDPAKWPDVQQRLADLFRTKTLEEWRSALEGTDACFAPVLTFDEAPRHPHNIARSTFVEVNGVAQPAPAPRFSRTPSDVPGVPTPPGGHTRDLLVELGLSDEEIKELETADAVRQA